MLEFLDVHLSKEESFTNSSEKIFLKPGKTYLISTKVQKFQGDPYCAYFGEVSFNEKDEEISRKIKWLDAVSENKIIKLIFKTPKNIKYAQFVYRINEEVPFKSNCKFRVLNPNLVEYEIDDSLLEDYDIPENFQLPFTKELTQEEENKLEKNLVWILGAPRSGTSWLGTQLLSYQTETMNEPLIGRHLGLTVFRSIDHMRTIDLFEREEDYFFSNKYQITWIYFVRKMILNRIYTQFSTLEKKIVIKEPNGSLGSDIIMKCLPKSKLIFLVRDGRDVLDSSINSLKENSWAVKRYHVRSWPKEKIQRIKELEVLAKIWVKSINIIMKTYSEHHSDLRLKVKYEDLLDDTLNQLQKIYDFLKIKIPEKNLHEIIEKYNFKKIPEDKKGSGKITRSASPGKWKDNFLEQEKTVMKKIMRESLQKLGYLD